MKDLICYCFNYSKADLKEDILKHKKSTIEERIKAEKMAGKCQCKTLNPKGI